MAEAKIQYNVSLDDESKELIRQLVKAVDRIADAQAPEADVSFGDRKRLIEEPTYTYPTAKQRADIRRILERRGSGEYRPPEGEGDHVLYNDGHEGEDTE